MEPHPHAWPRSRVLGMYFRAADDGPAVTILRRRFSLLGEAALFRDSPEWEMAVIRDDILLRDGAGRNGLAVTVLRRGASMFGEAALFCDSPEWEMAVIRDDILLRDGAGRDGLAVTVLRRSASLFGDAALFRDSPAWEMAGIRDDILLRDGAGRDVTVLRRSASLFGEAALFHDSPEWEIAGMRDEILLRDDAGRDGRTVTVLRRSASLFGEVALFHDSPEWEMAGMRDDILLRDGAGRDELEVGFHNLVAREGIPGQLKGTGTSSDDVLLQSNGVFMAREPGDGARHEKAAADIFLALGDRGDWIDRPMLAVELGAMYWVQELTDWVYRTMGSPRYRPREAWSWQGVVGYPIAQKDYTCAICASLVCLEAQHRLDWERRYGYGTFPYRIPASTVAEMKNLCRECGVWTAKVGAAVTLVLELFQEEGGCAAAADVPGWKDCKLQLKGKTYHPTSQRQPMPAPKLTRLIHEEGPILGAILVDRQTYYAHGWQHRVYRGLPKGHKGGVGHVVVCMGYCNHPTGQRHGNKTELLIEVIDNHRPNGPIRWVAATAFKLFWQIHVEPLNATELRDKVPRIFRW